MQVTEARYLTDRGLLLYVFDTGAWMGYGPGVLPGTDVETYRFVVSRGFKDRDEYKAAQGVARAYSKGLGFRGIQGHFESFQVTPPV